MESCKIPNFLGLSCNNPRGKPPIEIDELHARCSYCGDVVLKTEFALVQNKKDGRRLSRCRKCRREQTYESLTNDVDAFLRDKYRRVRERTSKKGIDFDMSVRFLHTLYEDQNGLCFYTDVCMTHVVGKGMLPTTISLDRVNPLFGYLEGNVVLCTNRINTIKQNILLQEMKLWMPDWYRRVLCAYDVGRLVRYSND